MRKKIRLLPVILALICCINIKVLAVDVPNMEQKGKIDITMHMGETIVPGGTLTLYRVGEIKEDDGNYSFEPTGDFADCGESFANVKSPELAKRLADYAESYEGVTKSVGQDGKVSFDNLELGLYLLVQKEAADGYNRIDPFLVSVPYLEDGVYIYEVDASPKLEVTKSNKPSGNTPTVPKDSKLPQTGQLNWPIPVLAIVGILLFAAGWSMNERENRIKTNGEDR